MRQQPRRGRHSVQEVIEQAVPVLGQDRLGMELHSMHRMLDMLNRHNLAVLGGGGDLEARRNRRRCNHQRVVPGGGKGVG